MMDAHPEIGAIVLECTNMPPYRADIQALTGLPVFDITTLVRMVHEAVRHGLAPRPAYPAPLVTQTADVVIIGAGITTASSARPRRRPAFTWPAASPGTASCTRPRSAS